MAATVRTADLAPSAASRSADAPPAPRNTLFPSYFLGGFECSSHIYRTGGRQDYLALTHHDRLYREDYALVRSVGIRAIRDGLHWHLCDCRGRYDFDSVAPRVDAAQELGLVVLWDLFHYGYPDDLDPFDPCFPPRFADLAYHFARWLSARVDGPRFYTPLNEPSFFSWAAGEAAWFAPFLSGRGWDVKVAMVRAGLAATDALRAADPQARLLSVDPVIHAAPPVDSPDQVLAAARATALQYQVWDMLAGLLAPELGGAPEYLDVIGVNHYLHSQYVFGTDVRLELDDSRRRPFRDLLVEVYTRYRRPMVVSETSCYQHLRPVWLRYIVDECLAAMDLGVDLHGICLYPIVDIPSWNTGQLIEFGLWDLARVDGVLRRVLNQPYLAELRRSQQRLAARQPRNPKSLV